MIKLSKDYCVVCLEDFKNNEDVIFELQQTKYGDMSLGFHFNCYDAYNKVEN